MAAKIKLPDDFGTPKPGKTITNEQLTNIRNKFKKSGITISTETHGKDGGFGTYRGDPKVLENFAETLAKNNMIWGEKNKNITIKLAYESLGNLDDIAVTKNGVIILNKDIFDDTAYMKRYYDYLASHGTKDGLTWLVPGTEYSSIIIHEAGHRVMARNNLAYGKIRDIITKRYGSVEAYCLSYLSEYGMMQHKGRYIELLSELSSATLSTDTKRRTIAQEILKEVFES